MVFSISLGTQSSSHQVTTGVPPVHEDTAAEFPYRNRWERNSMIRSTIVVCAAVAVLFSAFSGLVSAATPEQTEKRVLEAMGDGEYTKAIARWITARSKN
jgi:hypothetical protein